MQTKTDRARLSGWKEIAAHLDVTVRTVQLWERRRGLPVHRISGSSRSRVFAYVDEAEAWLAPDADPSGRAPAEKPERSDHVAPERRLGRPRIYAPLAASAVHVAVAAGRRR